MPSLLPLVPLAIDAPSFEASATRLKATAARALRKPAIDLDWKQILDWVAGILKMIWPDAAVIIDLVVKVLKQLIDLITEELERIEDPVTREWVRQWIVEF